MTPATGQRDDRRKPRRTWRAAALLAGPPIAVSAALALSLTPRDAVLPPLSGPAPRSMPRRSPPAAPVYEYSEADLLNLTAREPASADDLPAPASAPTAQDVAARAVMDLRQGGARILDLLAGLTRLEIPSAEAERAIFDLLVNEVPRGQVVLYLQNGEVWLPVSALERSGLRGLGGVHQAFTGAPHVRLSSLAPTVTFALDDRDFTLRLRTGAELLDRTRRDLSYGRPEGMTFQQNTSGFVNYAANWRGSGVYDLTAEAGLSVGGALLQTTVSRSSYYPFLRGLTSLTWDWRERLVRWTVGDAYVPAGPLGGGFIMGGVAVAREFSIDPYFVRYPTVAVAGTAPTPSTADVYVNGHLLRREYLPPGEFELRNLPTPTGRGSTRVVVRDAFGREQQFDSPYFVTTALLARGLQEYRYQVGFERVQNGRRNFGYGAPAAFARHRVGLTGSITGGFQAEASRDVVAAGPLVTARLPLGEVEVAGSVSRRPGEGAGSSASVAYTYLGKPLSFGGFARGATDRYTALGWNAVADRPHLEASAYAGLTLSRMLSLNARQTLTESLRRGREISTALSASFRVLGPLDLFANLTRVARRPATGYEIFAGASLPLGPRSSSSVAVVSNRDEQVTSAEIARSLPRDIGWGYRLRASDGHGGAGLGHVQYQGQWGRYELGYETISGRESWNGSIAGGLALIGGGVFATRPINDAFALVRVPGVKGVRAYASNQEVGRTGRRGSILVPNLLSHYGNVLSIADDDVPLDRALGRTEAVVAPAYRGGALVVFQARQLRSASGKVVLRDGVQELTPRYGQLLVTVSGEIVQSPIGSDGEFYLEQVEPGLLLAVVEYLGRACRFMLAVPATESASIDLGTVACSGTREASR